MGDGQLLAIRNSLFLFFYLIILYFHLHAPVFNGNHTFRFLFLFILIYLFFNSSGIKRFFEIFSVEFRFVLFFIIYCIFRTLIGGDSLYISMWIRTIFEFFLIPYVLLDLLSKRKLDSYKNFNSMLLLLGCMGAIITALCIINPSFNEIIKAHFSVIEDDNYLSAISYRCFGISDSLPFSYGIIQGIILLIGLIYIKENKWGIIFLPFIAISILLNARTGFLIAVLGFLVYIIFAKPKLERLIPIIALVGIGVIVAGQFITNYIDEKGLIWLTDFFNELDSVFLGSNNDTATADMLLGDMLILPTTLGDWLIGKGYRLWRTNGDNSDVGYVLQLMYGGILYVFPLYLFIYKMYKRLRSSGYKVHAIIFLVIFSVSNIKGDFFPYNGAFRLLFFYYCFLIYNNRLQYGYKNITFHGK